MTLKLYNTLTRRKEPFQPIDPGNVRVYACGPTVYDYVHIGNGRMAVVFDVLFRLLRHLYGADHVTYVRNITDVDDKINARAAEAGVDIRELTERTARQYQEDVAAIGCLRPTAEPRATEYIRRADNKLDMVRLIETLVQRGHAYVADDHVLFDVASMPDYGRLANRSLEEMEAGARVEVAPYKKGPMDFVLWKPSKPGEPSWPSPAGIATPGRPGWHIECSAMSGALLGETFDIHGGGIDLVFPHHENEIAQSRCAHGTPVMATFWLHNGFLQVEGEKMSKSLGNFVTIRQLLDTEEFGGRRWPGEVLRLAMLMTHYREPINWSISRLNEAVKELWSWIENYRQAVSDDFFTMLMVDSGTPDVEVVAALSDDLNTPKMLTRLRELSKLAEGGEEGAAKRLVWSLIWLGLYRRPYHDAYGEDLPSARGTEASGGRAPPIHLITKYAKAYSEAKVIVLNEYLWNTPLAEKREQSRIAIEQKINHLWSEMKRDRVAFRLDEHCYIELEPLGQEGFVGDNKVEALIAARSAARKAKDFKAADRIRDELAAMGIALKDSKDPATGEIATTWGVKR